MIHNNSNGKGKYFYFIMRYGLTAFISAILSVGMYYGIQYMRAHQKAVQEAHQTKESGELNALNPTKETESSSGAVDGMSPSVHSDSTAYAQNPNQLSMLRKTSESFRMVAKKVGPAVVFIKSTHKPRQRPRMMLKRRGGRGFRHRGEEGEDGMPFGFDPFSDFFEFFGGGSPFLQPPTPQVSMGSGIIIDTLGHIVTNQHVIEGGDDFLITLNDNKTEIKAKLVGYDVKTDIAVLKAETTKNLPHPAEWANSSLVEVGDWAIAIGSPFSLGQAVTVGIISAKGNHSQALNENGGGDFGGDLLQTDAAINPGNSGGPLCDLDGKVMGVNRMIFTKTGGYMGIGFAISSNLAKDIVGKLLKFGKVMRGWLGVLIQNLDAQVAKQVGIQEGVVVHEVSKKSPAESAGIKAGDIITEVNGKPIKEVGELQKIIGDFKPNELIHIKIIPLSERAPKPKIITVRIGELPDANSLDEENGGMRKEKPTGKPDNLGLIVGPMKGRKEGIIVEYVAPGYPTSLGLLPGDIIHSINNSRVTSLSSYRNIVKNLKKTQTLFMEIERDGSTKFYQFSSRGFLPDENSFGGEDEEGRPRDGDSQSDQGF